MHRTLPLRRRTTALVMVAALVATIMALGQPTVPVGAQTGSTPGEYVALSPARILDARQPGGGGIIPANSSRDIQISGLDGVPTSGVLAVVVDLSVVSTTSDGWSLLWEAGTTRPFPASSINYVPGRAVTNAATSKVSAAGKVSYYTYGSPADVIVDVVGYYRPSPGAAGYVPVTQTRILDTRDLGTRWRPGRRWTASSGEWRASPTPPMSPLSPST